MTFTEIGDDCLQEVKNNGIISSEGLERMLENNLPRPVNYEFSEDERGFWGKIIGSGKVTLRTDGYLILGPGSVYRFSRQPRVERTPLHRELIQTRTAASLPRRLGQALRTRAARIAMGESAVLNVYHAEQNGASLEISTDNVGEGLYVLSLKEKDEIIARRGVWFGMEEDVSMQPHIPLFSEVRCGLASALLRAAYGPGPILQKFKATGKQSNVLFNFGGSWEETTLHTGERSDHFDPRHLYAWDSTLHTRLVPYGHCADMFTQPDEIRYYLELEGPGRFWHSNGAYADGYVGHWFTPASWASTLLGLPGKVINLFHNPIKPL